MNFFGGCQGYLPSQLFNLDGSKYGSQHALEELHLGLVFFGLNRHRFRDGLRFGFSLWVELIGYGMLGVPDSNLHQISCHSIRFF